MITKYFLDLKTLKCACKSADGATCSNLGKLQPKLGDWSLVDPNPSDPKAAKSIAVSCPGMEKISNLGSSPLGVEFNTQGRLHLFNSNNQWLYKGITPIPLTKKTNEISKFSPASGARGGELNCNMSIYYDVNTVSNLVVLTRQLVETVVQLVIAFFRGLFSAIAIYVQSLPIALAISVEELSNVFDRSETNRSPRDQPTDHPDDSESSSESSLDNSSDDSLDDDSEPPADS